MRARAVLAVAAAALAATFVTAPFASTSGPTGRLLFSTTVDDVSGRLVIATINPDRSGYEQLTHQVPSGYAPRWTSDGRSIVYVTYNTFTEASAWWRMRANGTSPRRLPTS